MRHALAPLIAVVLLVPTASADLALTFAEPATIRGELEIPNASWVAVRLPEGARLDVDIAEPSLLVLTNYTYPIRVETPVTFTEAPPPEDEESSSRPLAPMQIALIAGPGGATLAMKVEGVIVGAGDAEVVQVGEFGGPALLDEGQHHQWSSQDHRWSSWSRKMTDSGVAIASTGPLHDVSFDGLHVSAMEWSNMRPVCSAEGCPTGGGRTQEKVGLPGAYLAVETMRFERLHGPSVATAEWSAAELVAVGPVLDIQTNGEAHLPVAAGSCPGCPPIVDETLTVTGFVALEDIRPQPSGFSAQLSGDFESARVDETWVSPARLGQFGAATAAAIGVAVLVKLLLVPLFTRLGKQEALEHPKRQKIYHYIQEHPGANFREVARNTDIAAGTVRHHLTVLERAGHVVEHAHQGTVRLFENHGKFDHNWSDVVLLREPPLAKLHDWLKAHPGSPQKLALEAMEFEGWSRSTTQHRLSRLVEGGVAVIRLQGRLKIYNIVDRTSPKPLVQLVAARPAFAT